MADRSGGGKKQDEPRWPGVGAAQTIRPDQTMKLDRDAVLAYRESRRKGSLLVIAGAHADVGNHMLVEDEVVIGRDAAGLLLRDGLISRNHAQVEHSEEEYRLRDLDSTNGTLLNGERVSGEKPLRDGDKIQIGETVIKFTMVDITEAEYLRRIERLAGIDELTNLPAKHRYDSLLQDAIQNVRFSEAPLSAMMMDLDGLKAINDRHGHNLGAHTISQVGAILGEIFAGRGEVTRFGGDEYSAFLPGMSLEQALLVAERIRKQVAEAEFTLKEITVSVTISIGVAQRPAGVHKGRDLIDLADKALYRAKAKGRDAVSD